MSRSRSDSGSRADEPFVTRVNERCTAPRRAEGSIGPNLDDLKPNEATVKNQVRNGGGGMPAFGGRLTDAQIKAVAQYVAQSAGKSGSSAGGGGGP
jgi:hypothetical protein